MKQENDTLTDIPDSPESVNKRKLDRGYSGAFMSMTNVIGDGMHSLSRRKKFTNFIPKFKDMVSQGFDKRSAPDRVAAKPRLWTQEEDDLLRAAVEDFGERHWKLIAERVPGRNHTQCLQRWSKVLAPGLKKGQWSDSEDKLLLYHAQDQLRKLEGRKKVNWGKVAKKIPGRTAKQCRERWVNNLNPDINRSQWTPEEDQVILNVYSTYPKKWATIAKRLNGRTENAVKIRYKTLKRNGGKVDYAPNTFMEPKHSTSSLYLNNHNFETAGPADSGDIVKLEKSFSGLTTGNLRPTLIKDGSDRSVLSSVSISDMIARELLQSQANGMNPAPHQPNAANPFYGVNFLNVDTFGSLNYLNNLTQMQPNGAQRPSLVKSGSDRSTVSLGILRDLIGTNSEAQNLQHSTN